MKIKTLVALSALAFASSAAMAGDWYAVGSIGQAKVKDFNQNAIDGEFVDAGATGLSSSIDKTDTAYKLQAGYQFNKNFALEGGYFNLGKATYTATFSGGNGRAEYKADGWNLSAVGILPLNEQFSLFGKLGAAYSTAKASFNSVGSVTGSDSEKDSNWGAVYGIGASYNLTKQVSLRAEYEVYDKVGKDDTTGQSKVDMWSLGVAYKF